MFLFDVIVIILNLVSFVINYARVSNGIDIGSLGVVVIVLNAVVLLAYGVRGGLWWLRSRA